MIGLVVLAVVIIAVVLWLKGKKEVPVKPQETLQQEEIKVSSAPKKQISPQGRKRAIKHCFLTLMQPETQYTAADLFLRARSFYEDTTQEEVDECLTELWNGGTGEIQRMEQDGEYVFCLRTAEKMRMTWGGKKEATKRAILANMKPGERYTIRDMLDQFDCFDDQTSPQRVSALLTELGERGTGEIRRVEEGGKAYFSLVPNENEAVKREILASMEPGARYTIGDMIDQFDCFHAQTSPQRISALLNQLGPDFTGEIISFQDERKTFYRLANDDDRDQRTAEIMFSKMKPGVRYTVEDMLDQFDCFGPDTPLEKVRDLLPRLNFPGMTRVIQTQENGNTYYSRAEGTPCSVPQYSPPTHTTSTPSYSSPQYSYDPSIPLYSLNTGRGLSQSELDYYGTAAYNGFPAAMMDVIGAERPTLDSMLGRLDAIKDVADEIKKMRLSSIDRAAFEQACYRAGVDPDSFRQSDLDELQNFLNQP